ncbi:MAG: hypothetical protein Solumvirus2_21 [Solumvirus sp.]|uniref:Uncharacterized protein n=1 Tax=Solumvirus sp. TaxID=2487773 RepID=A0A3G5AHZ9_9VIRU|nr:MAG: hypothetical protein Solumvirus2_21 [Solumvirus sp.]
MSTIHIPDPGSSDTYKDLVDTSKERLQSLLDLIQDVFIYGVLGFISGSIIERIFAPEDVNIVKSHSTFVLILLIFLQLIVDAIAIFYINLFITALPRFTNIARHTRRDKMNEIDVVGSVVISLIFFGTQTTLILRIRELVNRLKIR